MTDQHTTQDNANTKPVTTAAWKKSAFHTIRCHSGAYVTIRIPDLPALIEAGDIPQNLLDVALKVAGGQLAGEQQAPSLDLISQSKAFTDVVVLKSVTEPKITEADLPDIPYEDKQLIVEIATRQRDVDAEGHYLAGLETSEKFRRFRRIGEFHPSLADY